MADLNIHDAAIENARGGNVPGARLLAAVMLLAITAAAALWWRFGESVYMTSIMNAVIACF